MMQGLVGSARLLLDELRKAWLPGAETQSPLTAVPLAPLERIIVSDGVGRTLFEQFDHHKNSSRRDEETGWVLLGLRETRQAVVLATLPAGIRSDAGVAHIRFNSIAQALGSRMVRRLDRRLTILGVVHTHPGSLRHPSVGDLHGDLVWVERLRGQEGIFSIGTADAQPDGASWTARQPRPNVQCLDGLRFSWYGLRASEGKYRPLPVEWTLGPDLARELHTIWTTIEEHAEQVERLVQQQKGSRIEIVADMEDPQLIISFPTAENAATLRVQMRGPEVRYFLQRGDEVIEKHPGEVRVDRGVYLLLAELAAAA